MAYQATGNASSDEKAMSFKNSADNNPARPIMPAPRTLRIPISFVLRSAVKAARPNKPRQEIQIARAANTLDNLLTSKPEYFPRIYLTENNNGYRNSQFGKLVHLAFKTVGKIREKTKQIKQGVFPLGRLEVF